MLRRLLDTSEPDADRDPVHVFLSLMRTALDSGNAYLLDVNGREPESPARCGWHKVKRDFVPRGLHIGWVDGDDLLLTSEVYEVLEHLASRAGNPLWLLPEALWQRLRAAGLLHGWELDHCVTRRTVHGRERFVLHMNAQRVLGIPITRH